MALDMLYHDSNWSDRVHEFCCTNTIACPILDGNSDLSNVGMLFKIAVGTSDSVEYSLRYTTVGFMCIKVKNMVTKNVRDGFETQ